MKEMRKVTVVGANGTMGRNIAAIFASFGNADVYLVSRSIEKSVRAKDKAYQSVRAESVKERMIPADYEQLKDCIMESDLVFEACAENFEIKKSVHHMIAEALEEMPDEKVSEKVICTGTSGLSVTALAKLYKEQYRSHILGMHFFNPPYQMVLCELVSTDFTDQEFFNEIHRYTEDVLLRTTVEVKDRPAFLGNRIGFQFINEVMQLAETYKYNGGIDYIDAIFGAFTGRAMAPLVTANFVGLDVHQAIMDNLYENTSDFAHESFVLPEYVRKLVQEGKLGRKAGAGLYKTIIHDSGVKIHQVYDIDNGYYRETMKYVLPFAEQMVSCFETGDYDAGFCVLKKNHSVEAELCLKELLRYVLYALNTATEVGYDVHSADDVMAAGFNWCPPVALMEALGGKDEVKALCRERLGEEWMSFAHQVDLIDKAEKSKYDYRRFFKAKH